MKLDTAFLLGAGFSLPAGIPVMSKLAQDFPDTLDGRDKEIYLKIRDLVPNVEKDFELLMEICYDLKKAPINLINQLTKKCFGQQFGSLEELVIGTKRLDFILKEYLQSKLRVKRSQLEYLYPFAEWIKRNNFCLDIFTLNYDLVIENLCEEFYLSYTDGFLINWQPELFQKREFRVNLYKLHGSFIWYQSELGERIKIPVIDSNIKYLANEEMVSMMVYPRQKKEEPFQELLKMFSNRLLTLDKLVVIGYSFRDEELFELIESALKKNCRLKLELIGPEADQLGKKFGFSPRIQSFKEGVQEWIVEKKWRGE